MADDIEPFVQWNNAPQLPHYGQNFVLYGVSGIFTFRIDTQDMTFDGHVMIGGKCIEGTATYPTGNTENMRGQLLTATVTLEDYYRLTDAPTAH